MNDFYAKTNKEMTFLMYVNMLKWIFVDIILMKEKI